MRRQLEHHKEGIFVAEGEKVVRRLLESNFTVVSVLLPEKWVIELEPLLTERSGQIEVFVAEKQLLETLTGFSMYQGLLAVAKVPKKLSLAEILAGSSEPYLFMAVDSVSNAQNLGALVRNGAAFDVHGLIVGETCCSPFLRRAVRGSMGAIFNLPVLEPENLATTLRELREHSVQCIAAHPHVQGRVLSQADFTQSCCLVFGSEGYGISPAVMQLCVDAVAIPMARNVDSLNVSSAGAVFLYEANRQRRREREGRRVG